MYGEIIAWNMRGGIESGAWPRLSSSFDPLPTGSGMRVSFFPRLPEVRFAHPNLPYFLLSAKESSKPARNATHSAAGGENCRPSCTARSISRWVPALVSRETDPRVVLHPSGILASPSNAGMVHAYCPLGGARGGVRSLEGHPAVSPSRAPDWKGEGNATRAEDIGQRFSLPLSLCGQRKRGDGLLEP